MFITVRFRNFLGCFTIFLMCMGCASTTKFSYVKQNLKSHYIDGKESLYSKKPNSTISLTFENLKLRNVKNTKHSKKKKRRTYIRLEFTNLSNKSHMVNPDTIYVLRKSQGDKFYAASYSDIIKKIEGNKNTSLFFQTLNERYNNSDLITTEEFYEREKQLVLKKNTLLPGNKVEGRVAIHWPELKTNKDDFVIVINFAGDKHKFHIRQSLIEK